MRFEIVSDPSGLVQFKVQLVFSQVSRLGTGTVLVLV